MQKIWTMIPFKKYHCLGRDFILLDNREGAFSTFQRAEMARFCARRFGIGASGILRVDKCSGSFIEVRSYNFNGVLAELNVVDAACIAVFAKDLGFLKTPTNIEINDQIVCCKIVSSHENMHFVNVRMLDSLSVRKIFQHFVMNFGAQFCMVPMDDVSNTDVEAKGREIAFGKRFPGGANVAFYQPFPNFLEVRHYEHLVDQETYANGLCAIGAALSHAQNNPIENNYLVRTKGGEARVTFARSEKVFCNVEVQVLVNALYSGVYG